MLRNRVTSKQALMADHTLSSLSPTKNPTTKIPSFLNSPRFLNGFLSKNLTDPESTAMSPTSILDNKNSPTFVNPFGYDKNLTSPDKIENPSSKLEPQAIGLALIDSIIEEKNDDKNFFKPVNRMVLFGSKLKVQIPSVGNNPTSVHSPTESPESPADFGIKTKNCQMMMSPFSSTTVKDFSRQLSLKEMELSEDYTCVISHGPNKKTIHIYDDCVVESCDGDGDDDDDDDDGDDKSVVDEKKLECGFEVNDSSSASVDFLSFCYNCERSLEQGEGIYMYRGEKAFCSQECRGQEMLFEMKNPDSDDASV